MANLETKVIIEMSKELKEAVESFSKRLSKIEEFLSDRLGFEKD